MGGDTTDEDVVARVAAARRGRRLKAADDNDRDEETEVIVEEEEEEDDDDANNDAEWVLGCNSANTDAVLARFVTRRGDTVDTRSRTRGVDGFDGVGWVSSMW